MDDKFWTPRTQFAIIKVKLKGCSNHVAIVIITYFFFKWLQHVI